MTDSGDKPWWQTLPAILGGIAAVLAAAATLLAQFSGDGSDRAVQERVLGGCLDGYVYREAGPGDDICVTLETKRSTATENDLASSRVEPDGGPYGPDTCKQGYVWRDAFPGDHVCVLPARRQQAQLDNSSHTSRMR